MTNATEADGLYNYDTDTEKNYEVYVTDAEIVKDKVINNEGRDVTFQYEKGAELAYNICMYLGIRTVILKKLSPSCGSNEIYDGSFTHKVVTAALLKRKGIKVLTEDEIDTLL